MSVRLPLFFSCSLSTILRTSHFSAELRQTPCCLASMPHPALWAPVTLASSTQGLCMSYTACCAPLSSALLQHSSPLTLSVLVLKPPPLLQSGVGCSPLTTCPTCRVASVISLVAGACLSHQLYTPWRQELMSHLLTFSSPVVTW